MKRKTLYLVTGIFLMFSFMTTTHASEGNKSSFSISPVFSKNQKKDVTSFFDVRWTPNETTTIGVSISNHTNKKQTYQINVSKARTNGSGSIDYSDSTAEAGNTKVPLITSLISFPKEVTIESHSSKVITSEISFPDQDYNGIKMAGIQVKEKENSSQNTAAVQNIVSYVLPIVIRGNQEERPETKVNFGKVQLSQENFKMYKIEVPLTNESDVLLKDATLTLKVKDVKGKVVEERSDKWTITPETDLTYAIDLGTNYVSGEYTVDVVVRHHSGEWKTTQILNISKEEMNKIKVTIPQKSWKDYLSNPIIIVIGTILMTLFIGLTIYLVIKRLKK